MDLVQTPDKKLVSVMPSIASFVSAMHGNLTRMKIDVGSIKQSLANLSEKLAAPRKVKHVIVRTPTKAGGKQIARPETLLLLLEHASQALGIGRVVVARDEEGNKLSDEDVAGLRNGETVFVYTAGDE